MVIMRILQKLFLGQAVNQIADRSMAGDKQSNTGNDFQNSIKTSQCDSSFERQMRPLSLG